MNMSRSQPAEVCSSSNPSSFWSELKSLFNSVGTGLPSVFFNDKKIKKDKGKKLKPTCIKRLNVIASEIAFKIKKKSCLTRTTEAATNHPKRFVSHAFSQTAGVLAPRVICDTSILFEDVRFCAASVRCGECK